MFLLFVVIFTSFYSIFCCFDNFLILSVLVASVLDPSNEKFLFKLLRNASLYIIHIQVAIDKLFVSF